MTGYYNPRWLLKNIFDMNQADLENATEKLSDMLECEDIMKWCNEDERVDMINLAIVTVFVMPTVGANEN